jgi:histidyl-tRNA synthetase
VRDWDYYTGPIFELFTRDLGFPLGAGGRYDSLLARFGLALPATGFVMYVDRCSDALLRRDAGAGEPAVLRLGWADGQGRAAVGLAQRLRDRGVPVATDLDPTTAPGEGVHAYLDSNAVARWRDGAAWRSGRVDEAVAALGPADAAPLAAQRRGA